MLHWAMIISSTLGFASLFSRLCLQLHPNARNSMDLHLTHFRGHVLKCKPTFTQMIHAEKPFTCAGKYVIPWPGLCVPTALEKLAAYGPWSVCQELVDGGCFRVRLRTKESENHMWRVLQRAPKWLAREYKEAYRLLVIQTTRCSEECI